MAPRRSAARAANATPVQPASPTKRSVRGSSALAPDEAIPRRVTRGTSQQPTLGEGNVNNPRLPEVQIQQSYAYGSGKTPVLPTQLVARGKMNLSEMAKTIDAGVEQAHQHLQNHIEETHANLQKDSRAERARRRASREPSQETSVDGDRAANTRTQRVAAWASSLDESQQGQVREGDEDEGDSVAAPSTPDDASNKDTDPSSFPSGRFDHSYNYERGLRKPNVTIRPRQDPFFKRLQESIATNVRHIPQASSNFLSPFLDWFRRLFHAATTAVADLPNSPLVSIMTNLLFALLVAGASSLLFCYAYSNFVCDPYSESPIGLTLQKYCGSCTRTPSAAAAWNFTMGPGDDLSRLTTAINNINQQMRAIESRLSDKVDAQYAAVDKDMDALKRQHFDITNQLAGLKMGGTSSGDVASPVIAKVNYFAPYNGAMIEPRLTSPTLQRPVSFGARVILRMLGSTLHQTKPPITALESWQDVGDSWCSASSPSGQDSMRLGVRVTEMIFPTELVVENYPNAGTLFPGSTPGLIEVWADFEHLDSREWERLNIRQMQRDGPLGPSFALIGQAEYDASAEATHVQAFRLAVNQEYQEYAAQTFVVRVVSSYGSDYTCLYRVRLHGVPAEQHDGTD